MKIDECRTIGPQSFFDIFLKMLTSETPESSSGQFGSKLRHLKKKFFKKIPKKFIKIFLDAQYSQRTFINLSYIKNKL